MVSSPNSTECYKSTEKCTKVAVQSEKYSSASMNVEKKKSIHAQNIPHWKSQAWKSTMNDETNKNKI